mgnify:CR=1 FL=1
MCLSSNFAVFDLLKSGKITSSTIMASCSWAPEAVKFAKNNPEAVKSLINKVVAYGKSLGVAMPVFIPQLKPKNLKALQALAKKSMGI